MAGVSAAQTTENPDPDSRGAQDERSVNDDHGDESHTGEDHGDEDHGDDHGHEEGGEHEEGKTEIEPDAALKAGIVVEKAAPAVIGEVIPLTGRIVINQNAKANVRARFPGLLRKVDVHLGDTVTQGQTLAVIEANESLRDYNVTAPIGGVVLERNTNLGDVAGGEALFVIADLSEVWAKFHVFPQDAERVKSRQNVRVYTLDENKAGHAAIGMLFPTADEASQTLVAIAPLPNEGNMWRPGMTVQGDVTVSERQVPVAVRAAALQTLENQTVVFVKEGDSYAPAPVRTGANDGEYVEITRGLRAGQDYVAEGSFVVKADIMKAGAEHVH